jgi:tripartite-type tricarboxylate transporter receptor subunit TctC
VVTAWYGLQVPAGTPREIISRLNAEAAKAVRSERVARTIVASGLEPFTNSPEQFAAYIKEQFAAWRKVIEASGVAPR